MNRFALLIVLFVAGFPLDSAARGLFFEGGVDSVAIGTTSFIQYYTTVHDDNLVVEPGVHFVYDVDPSCGSFDGSPSFEGVTDANGRAISPFLTGTALTLACTVSLTVDGVADPLLLSVHVFSPAATVYTPESAAVDSFTGVGFEVVFLMTESGLPVNLLPVTVQIAAAPNGASATLRQDPLYLLNSGRVTIPLLANEKQGRYDVTSTNSGHAALVTVNQRKPR